MDDYAITEQVVRKPKPFTGLLRGMMLFLAVIFILQGILFSRGFMLPGVLMTVLYLVFEAFGTKEYEYRMEGRTLLISVIYGKRYRREVHELNLDDLEVVAPNWHDKVAKYRKKGGTVKLRKYDYTSYEKDTPYYTVIITEGRRKIKLLMDLTEPMLQAMKRFYPDRVFLQ